jgi:hypothetical protein
MYTLAECRVDSLVIPQSINDNPEVGLFLDTANMKEAMVIIQFGAIAVASFEAVALQESDTTSSFADITGATFTVTATDDNKVIVVLVNFANDRKRYIQVNLNPSANAALVSAVCVSIPLSGSPVSAATAGSYYVTSTRTQGLLGWARV